MKKIVFLCLPLLLIAFFLFFSPNKIYAWPDFSSNLSENTPGVTCGEANTSANRCCVPLEFKMDTRFNNYFDGPTSLIRGALEILVNNLIGGLTDAVWRVQRAATKNENFGCTKGKPSMADPSDPNCVCTDEKSSSFKTIINICNNIVSPNEKNQCQACLGGGTSTKAGIWTALGCVRSDLSSFIQDNLLSWGLRLAGLIALLCIIYSAFRLQTSQGNPEKIKKAQELLTSCIMGLLLIIFSVFILRIIGVDILKIPGFG